jgi:hypothetical protein
MHEHNIFKRTLNDFNAFLKDVLKRFSKYFKNKIMV